MEHYEYEITIHPAETFFELVYFCSNTGECALDTVPGDQAKALADLLNARGRSGWELVQVSFGEDGLVAFWKRKLVDV